MYTHVDEQLNLNKESPEGSITTLRGLIDLTRRAGEIADDKKDSCLFCKTILPLSDLYDHLANQIKQVARLSLHEWDPK